MYQFSSNVINKLLRFVKLKYLIVFIKAFIVVGTKLNYKILYITNLLMAFEINNQFGTL